MTADHWGVGTTGDAHAIYVNGDIDTIDDEQPTAEAVAINDGRNVGVGTGENVVAQHRGPRTRPVDLDTVDTAAGASSIRTATTSIRSRWLTRSTCSRRRPAPAQTSMPSSGKAITINAAYQ
jgi:hypothetical protein